jgi:hypothetical protein
MKRRPSRKEKRRIGNKVLRMPDLEIAKSAVLNSLSCPDAQRGYRHAIDEFVDWYCSEPRLSFSKTVVVRYRMHLEPRRSARMGSPATSVQLWRHKVGAALITPFESAVSPQLTQAWVILHLHSGN